MSAKKQSVYPAVILLIIFGFVLTSLVFGGSRSFMAERHANLAMYFTSFGKLIALLGAGWLLARAVGGGTLAELLPLTLPVIAGVMIAGFHWSAAAALGAIGVAVVLREIWSEAGGRREGRNRGDGGRRGKGGDRKAAGGGAPAREQS